MSQHMSPLRIGGRAAGVVVLLMSLGACDFKVTNPGPVHDPVLENQGAHSFMLTGAERALGMALGRFAHTGAAAAREIEAGGSSWTAGISPRQELGQLVPEESNSMWENGHNARWIAEDHIRRIEAAKGAEAASYLPLARMYLYAAYANRILGENLCETVYDGGPVQPSATHFDRAVAQFTKAIEIGGRANNTQVVQAAYAGRAQVYVHQGKWREAVADAERIPPGFRYQIAYRANTSETEANQHAYVISGTFRATTTWGTFYENYYKETADPRTPWAFDPRPNKAVGDAARVSWGRQVPFYFQTKYYVPRSLPLPNHDPDQARMHGLPVNLATYREMQLIIAEARLVEGRWQDAMQIINSVRTSTPGQAASNPLKPWTATNPTEAWTALKRERGIELWLEGRRLGDLRRWRANNTPGALHETELTPAPVAQKYGLARDRRDVCFPISQGERETNPNLRG